MCDTALILRYTSPLLIAICWIVKWSCLHEQVSLSYRDICRKVLDYHTMESKIRIYSNLLWGIVQFGSVNNIKKCLFMITKKYIPYNTVNCQLRWILSVQALDIWHEYHVKTNVYQMMFYVEENPSFHDDWPSTFLFDLYVIFWWFFAFE